MDSDFRAGRPRYLAAVYLRNDDDIDHEFALTVEQSGEIVQETTLEPDRFQGPVRVECEWSGRDPFGLTCTLSGYQTQTARIADVEE